jgi:hypothetical protein
MHVLFVVNGLDTSFCGLLNAADHCTVKHPDFKQENTKRIPRSQYVATPLLHDGMCRALSI